MLRFTIRDVLWLMVVVGMGVGWWLGRERLAAKVSALETGKERAELLARYWDVQNQEVMRAIKESGQEVVWRANGGTRLEKSEKLPFGE